MELRKDRKQRFQHRSLVRGLVRSLSHMVQPFQRRSLGLHCMDRMLSLRHSLVHKLICRIAYSSTRKA